MRARARRGHSGLTISPPADPFESQAARDGLVETSGALKTLAVSPDEDRERPALPGLGPARRARRDLPAGAAEGLLDHARQGQPGHPGGRHTGRGAGDRQRPGDRGRRHAGPLRAERLRPAARAQPAAVDQAARRACRLLDEKCVDRHRGEPRAVRALRRADALGRDRRSTRTSATTARRRSSRRRRRPAVRCARSRARPASPRRSSTRRSTTAASRSRTASVESAGAALRRPPHFLEFPGLSSGWCAPAASPAAVRAPR